MGFIDYHGKKKDHFSDVLDYSRAQQEEEHRQLEGQKAGKWLADVLYAQKPVVLTPDETTKRFVLAFRDLNEAWYSLCDGTMLDIQPDLKEQVRKNFLIGTTVGYLDKFYDSSEEKKNVLRVFSDRIYRLQGIEAGEILRQVKENSRYRRYLDRCFSLNGAEPYFYRLLGTLDKTLTGEKAKEFLECQKRFEAFLAYYLSQLTQADCDIWLNDANQRQEMLEKAKEGIRKMSAIDPKKLADPLCGAGTLAFNWFRVVLFVRYTSDMREGSHMIEDLFDAFDNNDIVREKPTSIVPDVIATKIRDGILPEITQEEVPGGEKIHFLDHVVYYEEMSDGTFKSHIGRLYFTDGRIAFRGQGQLDIPYGEVKGAVLYDAMPDILEIKAENNTYLLQPAEAELAYNALKMLAEKRREVRFESGEKSYEQFLSLSDPEAGIFALKSLYDDGLSDELKKQVQSALEILKDLPEKKANEENPVQGFVLSYLPSIAGLLKTYLSYVKGGTDGRLTEQVHAKTLDALEKFNSALTKKIYEYNSNEAASIIAEANALTTVFEKEAAFNEQLPFTFEDLSENGNLDDCIEAVKYISDYKLPSELENKLQKIVIGLRNLRKTMELYPDRINEIRNFLGYYVPEAVRIVVSFNRYNNAGLDAQTLEKVYNKVLSSVTLLDDAIGSKINDINRLESMKTVAQAEALAQIMGEDGFSGSGSKLKH